MRIRKFQLAVLSAIMLVTTPSQSSSLLEEVVVTAQKREQSLQDVGISINAFTGAQLQALGVEQSIDIATFTPGVHISGNLAGQNQQFSIRGVTQNDFNDIIEAPNAAYLDEGYLAIAQAQTFAVLDVERVEILKGPQGTLFGRNATGGLIHYVSNKPSLEETDGYLDVSIGRFDTDADANQYVVEGAVGGPLSDTVAGRVAVRYSKQDGYLNNL
ncbi:MAG: iron complex outermembrane receptor protein, partial [Arenicella sp.]